MLTFNKIKDVQNLSSNAHWMICVNTKEELQELSIKTPHLTKAFSTKEKMIEKYGSILINQVGGFRLLDSSVRVIETKPYN